MTPLLQTISPADGRLYVERALADESQIETALAQAVKAQKAWKKIPVEEKAVFCNQAVEYVLHNKETIGEEISWQMGRPIKYAQNEVNGFAERAHYMIQIAEHKLKPIHISELSSSVRYIKREPLGVVFVVAPWNYPYLTAVNAIMPALMAGNAVILKHSAQTPLCAERLAAAFQFAGLPKGVFQYLHLSHKATIQCAQSPAVNYVAFTGSVEGGKAIEKAIAGHFKSSGLELGGKDPAYVRADACLESAVENLVDGAFFNSGQSCCGIERIYVHQSRYNDFVESYVATVKQYQLGHPLMKITTLGPMVRASAADFVKQQIATAVRQGATTCINPMDFDLSGMSSTYLAPQVLIDVDHSMALMKEESFGPVIGIMPVDHDAQAIALMNDSRYGLTASIWTADMDGAQEIGDQLETGTVFMNRCDYLDPALAWTGVKDSGRGCSLSEVGYEMLTRPKSFHLT